VSATWSGTGSTRTLTYTIADGQSGQAAIDEAALKTALIAGITDAAGNAFAFSGSIPNIDTSALPMVDTTGPSFSAVATTFDESALIPAITLDIPNTSLASITLDTTHDELDFSASGNTDMWSTRGATPIAYLMSPQVALNASWSIETRVRINDRGQTEQNAGLTFYADQNGARPAFTYGMTGWDGNWRINIEDFDYGGQRENAGYGFDSAYLKVEVTEKGASDDYRFFYKQNSSDAWTQLGGASHVFTTNAANARTGLWYKTGGAKPGVAFDDLKLVGGPTGIVAPSTLAGAGGDSAGETITLTLTFDGKVNGLTSGSDSTIFTVGGSSVSAAWAGTNGTDTRTLSYTITAGQNGQAAINEAALKTALIAGITDEAGNAFAYSGDIPNIDSTALPVVGTGFDAAGDFIAGPTAQSANNIWQYFSADYVASNISNLQLLSDWDTSDSGVIRRPQWDGNHAYNLYPLVQKQENGALIIHPDSTEAGGGGKAVVVAWKNTTSSNVTVDLTGSLSLVGDILLTYGNNNGYGEQPSYDGIEYLVTTSSTGYASGTPTILLQGALDEDDGNSSPSSTNLNWSNQTLAPGAMISVAVHGKVNFNWDFTQLDLQITPEPLAGQSVVDLGSLGQLIAPVQVEGKWYYHLDRNGDGTIAGDAYTMSDANTYPLSEIYDLFKQDVNGVAGSSTNDTYRYATVNGVKLALPTLGTSPNAGLVNGTALNNATQTNPSYDDLSAIWDAYNGTLVGSYLDQSLNGSNRGSGNITSGAPGEWVNDSYVSATPWPSSNEYAALRVYDGYVFNHAHWGMNVALQVL
jgi:hypothetical protein